MSPQRVASSDGLHIEVRVGRDMMTRLSVTFYHVACHVTPLVTRAELMAWHSTLLVAAFSKSRICRWMWQH